MEYWKERSHEHTMSDREKWVIIIVRKRSVYEIERFFFPLRTPLALNFLNGVYAIQWPLQTLAKLRVNNRTAHYLHFMFVALDCDSTGSLSTGMP